MRRPTKDP
jgi:hypothetical protein